MHIVIIIIDVVKAENFRNSWGLSEKEFDGSNGNLENDDKRYCWDSRDFWAKHRFINTSVYLPFFENQIQKHFFFFFLISFDIVKQS